MNSKDSLMNPNKISAVFQSMRPPFLVLTPLCILLGTVLSEKITGGVDILSILVALLAAIAAHIGVNTLNEYFDFSSGLDQITNRSLFNGGSGSLLHCPQAHKWVLWAAIVSLMITITSGIYLVVIKDTILLPLGILGISLILTYTQYLNKSPWLCLFSPGLAFGPIFTLGGFLCATPKTYSTSNEQIIMVLITSLVPFFLTNNLLLLNQIPDMLADKIVGRNTFPIKYGVTPSIITYIISSVLATTIMLYCYYVFNTAIWFYLPTILYLFASFYIGLGIYYKGTVQQNKLTPYLAQNVALVLISMFIFSLMILVF